MDTSSHGVVDKTPRSALHFSLQNNPGLASRDFGIARYVMQDTYESIQKRKLTGCREFRSDVDSS